MDERRNEIFIGLTTILTHEDNNDGVKKHSDDSFFFFFCIERLSKHQQCFFFFNRTKQLTFHAGDTLLTGTFEPQQYFIGG